MCSCSCMLSLPSTSAAKDLQARPGRAPGGGPGGCQDHRERRDHPDRPSPLQRLGGALGLRVGARDLARVAAGPPIPMTTWPRTARPAGPGRRRQELARVHRSSSRRRHLGLAARRSPRAPGRDEVLDAVPDPAAAAPRPPGRAAGRTRSPPRCDRGPGRSRGARGQRPASAWFRPRPEQQALHGRRGRSRRPRPATLTAEDDPADRSGVGQRQAHVLAEDVLRQVDGGSGRAGPHRRPARARR